MVHGGEKFSQSTLLTDEVLEVFEACNDLAPLHNPANLKGVNAVDLICFFVAIVLLSAVFTIRAFEGKICEILFFF